MGAEMRFQEWGVTKLLAGALLVLPVMAGAVQTVDAGGGKTCKEVVGRLVKDMLKVPGREYRMGRTEVTEEQWDAVMKPGAGKLGRGTYPVSGVSWNDCMEFVERLNAAEVVRDSGWKFRLPTVGEWSFACRAGSRGSWGVLRNGAVGKPDEVCWHVGNSGETKAAVAQKEPNAWGFYDMHGNVYEWCSNVSSGLGGDFRDRIGGSFMTAVERCAAGTANGANRQFSRYSDQGFRLLCERAR